MSGYDSLAQRQSNPCAFKIVFGVYALKYQKNILRKFLFDTDAVILNHYLDIGKEVIKNQLPRRLAGVKPPAGYMDYRRYIGTGKFKRVAQQIVKELGHLYGNGFNLR
jgi:hypothetical protein